MTGKTTLLAASILSLGIAFAGFSAGQSLVHSRLGFRTVTVKGLSERPVKADLGFWQISFVATGDSLEEARQGLGVSEAAVTNFLTTRGFPATAFQVQSIRVEDKLANSYGSGYSGPRFVLTENLLVKTNEVDKLAETARNTGDLLKVGVVFASDGGSSGGPSFQFTGLNEMKGALLTEATQRAREAADKFAKESGAKVGAIQNANQGVIEVNAAVEVPDTSPDRQIDKKVRVVTTITYFLKD
ncbi:MAG: hypothetical protein RLZZ157_1892 [Pseudomonadota bacterium]|jgi:hypothetical protein